MKVSRCAFISSLIFVTVIVFSISLLFPTSIFSQTSSNPVPDQNLNSPVPKQPQKYESAMVVLDGKNLFRISGVKAYPAEKRAEKIVNNIIQLAEDHSFDPKSLEIKEDTGVFKIYAGDLEVVAVFAEDAKLEGDFEPEVLANELFREQIIKAIESYRYERRSGTMKSNIIRALIRTGLLALVLVILFWIFRKVDQLFETRLKRKIDKLESKSKKVIQSEEIWSIFKFVNRLLRAAVVLFVITLVQNRN